MSTKLFLLVPNPALDIPISQSEALFSHSVEDGLKRFTEAALLNSINSCSPFCTDKLGYIENNDELPPTSTEFFFSHLLFSDKFGGFTSPFRISPQVQANPAFRVGEGQNTTIGVLRDDTKTLFGPKIWTLQNVLNIPSRHPDHQHVEIYVVKEEGSTMNTSGSHAAVSWADVHTYGELLSGRGDLSILGSFTQMFALGQSSRSTLAEEAPGQRMCSLFSQDVFQSDNSDEDIDVLLTNEANDDFDDNGHEDPNIDVTSEFAKGMVFKDKDAVIRSCNWYHVKKNKHYHVVETNKNVWSTRCSHDCPWKLRACLKKQHGFFEIKQYSGPHTCLHGMESLDHRNINLTFIAHLIKTQVAKAWLGRTKAIAMVFGDWDSSYNKLSRFMRTLKLRTPGTAVILETLDLGMEGVTLISDRYATVISVVKHEWETTRLGQPIGIHRYCLRHFRRTNSESAARVYRALCNEDPRKWTLAHDGGFRWGVTTTNDSECYNNVLRGARDLPITLCVEVTFYRLVATFNDKRRQIESALAKGLRYTSKVLTTDPPRYGNMGGTDALACKRCGSGLYDGELDPRVLQYVLRAGFYGECQNICMQAFGVILPAEEIDSGHLRMSWLRRTFDVLPEHADDVSVQRHARAYIVRHIGGLLLIDYSQTLGVHFSGGPWGTRWRSRLRTTTTFTHVVRVYRDQLDRLRPNEFTWRSYDAIMHELPDYCRVESDIWVCRSSLVCFEVVECHLPDRRARTDWTQFHLEHIDRWHHRREYLVVRVIDDAAMHYDDPYMVWYQRITRTLVGNPAHRPTSGYIEIGSTIEIALNLFCRLATSRSYMIALIVPSMRTISRSHYKRCAHDMCSKSLHALRKHQRIGQPGVPEPPPTMPPGVPATSPTMPPTFPVHPPPSTSSSQQFTQYVGATQTSASYITPTMPSYMYRISSHDVPSSSRPSSSGVRPRRTTHRHITSSVKYDQSSSFLPVGDEEEFDGYVDPLLASRGR
ncbi:hypothetical protein Acr_14g0007110 [Actinidia rufa]|uniref:Transposase MuDR plant domain-containing protein n=1 Tax=Actinidia rufa TaxID=165716 RepID=A0A7J0FQS7_9ERIC|nr:hypothetical protein Acr_14g0007110 [Actinidia rufa]